MAARSMIMGAAALAVALGVLPAGPAPAEERTVRIYNWSDYIEPGLLDQFTARTGIKVVYDTYDNNEILETKLLAGRTGYDLVVPTGTFLARQIQAGLFRELDRAKLPNWSNLDEELLARVAKYDSDNRHAFVYMWGTSGIAYNVAKVRKALGEVPVDSWSLLFDPKYTAKLKDCGIYLLDSPEDVLASVLRWLGEDPDSKDPKVLEKAAEVVRKVRPHVRKFHSSETINAMAGGDICIAMMYSGDAGIARTRGAEAKRKQDIAYVVPKEGALLWFDMMAIPKDAPNPEAAHAFMNFMMEPEVIAAASNFVTYPSGNREGMKLVNAELRADPHLFPPPEVKARLFVITPNDQRTQRVVTRLWTQATKGR
jgi:putrescine transport system substrate-binding protein